MGFVAVPVDEACTTILFDVDVPFVAKYVSLAPKARAAASCASRNVPVGDSSESSPPTVDEVSAKKMCSP